MKNNLKKFRKQAKLTLEQLAEKTSVSKTRLHELEYGENPTLDTAYRVARGLKTTIESIWPEPMRAGDKVEFLSDIQTDKGPSSGTIIMTMGDQLLIEHSDCSEEFNASDLDIVEKSQHNTGVCLWQLA